MYKTDIIKTFNLFLTNLFPHSPKKPYNPKNTVMRTEFDLVKPVVFCDFYHV